MAENDGKVTPPEGEAKPDKTFTQAELDEIIGKRLARQKADFADYDELKSAKTELDEIKARNASDLEKAVEKARKEGESVASTRANQRLVASEARALAAAAGFHNPRDAAQLLDLSKVKVTDDGDVDGDAVKALIDDLAKERPYLVKTSDGTKKPKPDPAQGNRTGGKPSGSEAGLEMARRRFPELTKK